MDNFKDMMEKVKKLKNGIGVQALLDEAYKIMGKPILMHNTEYELMAYTKVITDDPIWNEYITYGTVSKETQQFFVNEGFIEEVANASKVAFLKSEKLPYDRYVGKIFNKNNAFVANLVIMACNKPFEENDLKIFEIICKLITREISKDEFYQEYEQSHQEILVKNLIDGNYDKKLDIAQVEILYDTLGPNLYIAVADISQCNQENRDVVYIRNMLKQIKPVYKYAIYSGFIVIIISTNDESLNVKNELKELVKFFEQNNIYAGISRKFENLFELQKYYKDALESLNCVLNNKSSQRIFPFDFNSLRTMHLIKETSNGNGIQYFLNKGPEIFGNPLLFHDMELNLLAYTQDFEIIDPIWQELITYGTSSDETIKLFGTEGFINTMENTKGGALLLSDKIKYDRISWRIYNHDKIMIGCLSIVNTNKQFSEDELVLFGAFSQKFSNEVDKIEFYNNYGQVYSETVINRLISGKIDDYSFYSVDIGNLYNNLMNNLFLVVVDTSRCVSEQINLTFFRDLFNWTGTVNRYAIYSNCFIIIISVENMPLNANKDLDKINEVFKQHNIYAGISSCFENIYDLNKHYKEAIDILGTGMKKHHKDKWIFQ